VDDELDHVAIELERADPVPGEVDMRKRKLKVGGGAVAVKQRLGPGARIIGAIAKAEYDLRPRLARWRRRWLEGDGLGSRPTSECDWWLVAIDMDGPPC
jgi:hypothetical protein